MDNKKGKEQYRRILVFIYDVFLITVTVGIWTYVWLNDYLDGISRYFWVKGNILMVIFYLIIIFTMTGILGGYKVGYHSAWELFFSGALALLITNVVAYIQVTLLSAGLVAVKPLLTGTVIGIAFTWIWAFAGQWAYKKIFPPYQILMIYNGKDFAQNLLNKVMTRNDKYHICQVISMDEGIEFVKEEISKFTTVLFSDLKSAERNILLKHCYNLGIRVYLTPKLTDIIVKNSMEIELFDSPIFVIKENEMTIDQLFFKRMMDIAFSLIIGIVTLPLWVFIALLIKIEDGGGVIYKQERLTKGGKTFQIYKFRSMVMDVDKNNNPCLAAENDNRITKIGRFTRKFRLDELPQLVNILKGEMSLVGPRPEHPQIAAEYEKTIPEFKYRLKVKAGLTGYAQVIGKYNTSPYDKLRLDIMYISGYSLLLDLKLCFLTLKIIFKKDSTEGVKKQE